MSEWRSLFWFTAWVLVAGCGGANHEIIGQADDGIDPVLVTCRADSDCVLVEMGCCDTCNGGWSMSVRKDHVDAATRLWKRDCSGGVTCTELACEPPDEPICVQQRCAVRLPLFDVVVHNPRRSKARQRGWPPGVSARGRER